MKKWVLWNVQSKTLNCWYLLRGESINVNPFPMSLDAGVSGDYCLASDAVNDSPEWADCGFFKFSECSAMIQSDEFPTQFIRKIRSCRRMFRNTRIQIHVE